MSDNTVINIGLIELLLHDRREEFIQQIIELQSTNQLTTELYTSLLILTATVFNNFVDEPGQLTKDWLEHVNHAAS